MDAGAAGAAVTAAGAGAAWNATETAIVTAEATAADDAKNTERVPRKDSAS